MNIVPGFLLIAVFEIVRGLSNNVTSKKNRFATITRQSEVHSPCVKYEILFHCYRQAKLMQLWRC